MHATPTPFLRPDGIQVSSYDIFSGKTALVGTATGRGRKLGWIPEATETLQYPSERGMVEEGVDDGEGKAGRRCRVRVLSRAAGN
jgi:hypothetical protein